MSFVFSDTAQALALGYLTGRLPTTEPLRLRLFVNNITPSETDDASIYTEATFPGYANILLAGANWSVGNPATYANQQFICSQNVATQYVYGYYLTRATSGEFICGERPDDAPYPITQQGNRIEIAPSLGAATQLVAP